MSLDKAEKILSIIGSLIVILPTIWSAVAFVLRTDQPATAPVPLATPSEKTQPGKHPNEEPAATKKNEVAGTPMLDKPEPFWTRATRMIKITNISALVFSAISLLVLLITLAIWPPPETGWAIWVAGVTIFGSILVLLYGVVMLAVGTCAGVMDWPATLAILVAIPLSIVDLSVSFVVDQRNVNPINLSHALQELHRARYTR